jgi:hypothetical protein
MDLVHRIDINMKNIQHSRIFSDQFHIQRDPSMSVHRLIGIGSCTTSTNQHVVQ